MKDDTLKAQMQSFLLSTASQNEITAYDNKVSWDFLVSHHWAEELKINPTVSLVFTFAKLPLKLSFWIIPFVFFLFFCFVLQIYETVETINQLKINREFFLGFARDPPVSILLCYVWNNFMKHFSFFGRNGTWQYKKCHDYAVATCCFSFYSIQFCFVALTHILGICF